MTSSGGETASEKSKGLTIELICLQLCLGALLLTLGAFLLTIQVFLLTLGICESERLHGP